MAVTVHVRCLHPLDSRAESRRTDEMAQSILAVHEKILRVLIVDKNGTVISRASRQSFEETFAITGNFLQKSGILARLTESIVLQAEEYFGPLDSIVLIFEKCKIIGIGSNRSVWLAVLVSDRSLDAVEIIEPTRALL